MLGFGVDFNADGSFIYAYSRLCTLCMRRSKVAKSSLHGLNLCLNRGTNQKIKRLMPRRRSIPILVLTGFLGSGKTTLLNHLLANNRGLRVGVLINDFGEINIDSMLVSAQTDTALELSNGCICCQIDGEDVDDAIAQLAQRGSQLDYIIIEASGVADPAELA